ncbi:MAG: RiPP maturation radical SAM protein 1, partial [bacterium]|nr:RiPP maturation radical SAM protein 1 [bacterium]
MRAALTGTGIGSEVVYGNLEFAETIGIVAYQAMQSAPTDHLLGEWCFSEGLISGSPPDDEEYLDLVLEVRSSGFPPELEQRKDLMRWVRAQTAAWVDRLARSIVARRPRIVGCSSVFQQHCASLALLRKVRELSPDTVTLMGGANCEGEMGLETLRVFPWIDCVVSGEADGFFRDLCELLLERGRQPDPARVPHGVLTRAHIQPSALAVSGNGC